MITIVSYSASTECTDPTADNASSFIADVVVASCAVHTFPVPAGGSLHGSFYHDTTDHFSYTSEWHHCFAIKLRSVVCIINLVNIYFNFI